MQRTSVNLLEAFQADFSPDFKIDNYEYVSLTSEHPQECADHEMLSEVSIQIGNLILIVLGNEI